MTFDGLRALVPDAVRSLVLVRTRPGVDPETLADELRDTHRTEGVYLPAKPSDLADLERVGGLPLVVAGLVGLMALAVLASTVSSTVRRRQRDVAVLKALGFVRGQVLSAVAWQSSTFALLTGLIGLPLGIATGRATWTVFAERLGVPPRPSTPLLTTALLVPALLLLANLMASSPADMPPGQGRQRPCVSSSHSLQDASCRVCDAATMASRLSNWPPPVVGLRSQPRQAALARTSPTAGSGRR